MFLSSFGFGQTRSKTGQSWSIDRFRLDSTLSNRVNSVNRVNSARQLSRSTYSANSVNESGAEDLVTFQKLWHSWNRRTMWSRVLSGIHLLKDLAYLLPLCNEDTSLVTPML
ncbi:hypothetical protein HanRHA438_Chr04g0162861 [Helianthus annuus]|uniref:Uncharacterized protein n=1 Tax=Helianthus annuus TaxID=4232 RepID=A0A251RPG4_HELAN|nr:hypothetical protein HanXRQr2_Chr04g0152711 [Helianthus annuus]KAJ0587552.1 hypothetical protein HanIR_Chr04g0164491 [Helianthus annuus]KAJ0925716.1 hypothetical protein HanRHA438_Chr04g0162861 [Helianthus annuus]KAJ0930240.1 hypothetical protein HanPSC8_Chr04g0147051 [Helianthus annuus]